MLAISMPLMLSATEQEFNNVALKDADESALADQTQLDIKNNSLDKIPDLLRLLSFDIDILIQIANNKEIKEKIMGANNINEKTLSKLITALISWKKFIANSREYMGKNTNNINHNPSQSQTTKL